MTKLNKAEELKVLEQRIDILQGCLNKAKDNPERKAYQSLLQDTQEKYRRLINTERRKPR